VWSLDVDAAPPRWRPRSAPEGACLCFSTRRGGISEPPFDTLNLGRSSGDRPDAIAANRRRLLADLGLDPARLATASQVHGARVERVSAPVHVSECDALVSTAPGLAIAVAGADCIPILFTAPGAVAAAHAGWRGVVAGVAEAALEALTSAAGARPDRATAHLGPCIRSCCFRVGPDVAARFPSDLVRESEGSTFVDLPGAARRRLIERGMDPGSIFDTGACTSCEPSWYYSHRRDHGLTGRLWGVVARLV
jgi:hypothetical protein